MSEAEQTIAPPPAGARVLEEGEIINDGDLHWNLEVKHWVAVTPQGEEKVAAGQRGFYCRRNGDV